MTSAELNRYKYIHTLDDSVDATIVSGEKDLAQMVIRTIGYFYLRDIDNSYRDDLCEDWLNGRRNLKNSGITSTSKCRNFLKILKNNFNTYKYCNYFDAIQNYSPDEESALSYATDSANRSVFNLNKFIDDAMTLDGTTLKPKSDLDILAPSVASDLNTLDEAIGHRYSKAPSSSK